MGIGPVFECPDELLERLPELCAAQNVGLEIVKDEESIANVDTYVIFCIFKGQLARIQGRLSDGGKTRKMWLTSPGMHALNPLLWPVDLRLSRKIERMLAENGARHCNWD